MIELNHVHILVAISTCLHTFPNSLPMNSTCISSEQRKLIRVSLPHIHPLCHSGELSFGLPGLAQQDKSKSIHTFTVLQKLPKLPRPRIPVPVALARWPPWPPCSHNQKNTTRHPRFPRLSKVVQIDQKLGELSRVINIINHKAKSYNYISHNSLNVFLKTCVFSRCGDRTCKVFKDQGGTCVKYSKSQGFPMHVRLTAIAGGCKQTPMS